ncbi:MAG: thioredoxin family protein [Bacilli bacterium]|nr:thioredoxin family protein [Bacilli bacterium]
MKKYGILLILFISCCMMSGCTKNYLVEISYDEYKQLLENKETFVLEVMKNDCISCKGIRPKLKKIAEKHKIEIKYIDLGKLKEEQIDTFGVSATPTIIFYTEGEEETTSARIEGNISEKKIIEKFKASSFIK